MQIGRRELGAGLVLSALTAGGAQAAEDVEAAVRARLDRFSALVLARDPALADEFLEPLVFVGSSQGERADSLEGLRQVIAANYAQPAAIRFSWASVSVQHLGDIAWLTAEGKAEFLAGGAVQGQIPYRVAGVFQRKDGAWRWRQFVGSQPTAD